MRLVTPGNDRRRPGRWRTRTRTRLRVHHARTKARRHEHRPARPHHASPPPTRDRAARERPRARLSIAQVVGGALAAMTAAALGSRLSVAGTVVGAAFASVIAAVAGALYTASLRRTSRASAPSSHGSARRPGRAPAPQVRGARRPVPDPATRPVTRADDARVAGHATGAAGRPSADRPPARPRRGAVAGSRIGWKPVVARRAADVRHRRARPDRHRAGDRSRPLRRDGHDGRAGRRAEHPCRHQPPRPAAAHTASPSPTPQRHGQRPRAPRRRRPRAASRRPRRARPRAPVPSATPTAAPSASRRRCRTAPRPPRRATPS